MFESGVKHHNPNSTPSRFVPHEDLICNRLVVLIYMALSVTGARDSELTFCNFLFTYLVSILLYLLFLNLTWSCPYSYSHMLTVNVSILYILSLSTRHESITIVKLLVSSTVNAHYFHYFIKTKKCVNF